MPSEANRVLMKYLKKFLPFIGFAIVFSVLQNYYNLKLPELLRDLVNDATIRPDGTYSFKDVNIDRTQLMNIFKSLVIIMVLSGVFGSGRILSSQYIGTNVVYGIRQDIYAALQRQSYSFYDKNRTGDIISKATRDVNVASNFLANQMPNFIRDIFTLAILLVKVFTINWRLSLIFLSLVPVLFGLMIWYRRHLYRYYINMSRKSGDLTSVLEENISGYKVVKAFAREKYELNKFKKINDQFLKSNLKISKLTSNYGPSQELITQVGRIFVLFLGAKFVIEGSMNPGEVIEFYVYFALVYDPIRGMVNSIFQYSQVQGALTRINSILQNKSEIVERENPIVLKEIKGKYEFKDVWFSYNGDDHYALKGINLKVEPGESLAIIGATGSGKSTFINLIPRFYDPTRGAIYVDGVDLRDLELESYRKQIGIVSQDVFLFSGTIRENITYGIEGDVPDEEVERVAKIASIHNFITSLPKGYKTLVGERGQTLSGGQKQRIAIARALLLNPRVLILDDSLSAVDIDTEAYIQAALDELIPNTTTFIITQRISTIRNCDKIMVLDYGEIVEFGTHDELYEKGGIYRKIYDTMFKSNTKRKERAVKTRIQLLKEAEAVDLDVESLGIDINEDIDSLIRIYEEKFPDPEERSKQIAKLQKIVERRRSRSDRNILRKKRREYMMDLIRILKAQPIIEIREVARSFYVSPEILEEELVKWQKELPFEIKNGTIVVSDKEQFDKQAEKIVNKIKEEMKEQERKRMLREERKLVKSERNYYLSKLIDYLLDHPETTVEDVAKALDLTPDSLRSLQRSIKRVLPIEFEDDAIYVKDREEFNIAVEQVLKKIRRETRKEREKLGYFDEYYEDLDEEESGDHEESLEDMEEEEVKQFLSFLRKKKKSPAEKDKEILDVTEKNLSKIRKLRPKSESKSGGIEEREGAPPPMGRIKIEKLLEDKKEGVIPEEKREKKREEEDD